MISRRLNENAPVDQLKRFWAEYRKDLDADDPDPKPGDWHLKLARQFVARTSQVGPQDKTTDD